MAGRGLTRAVVAAGTMMGALLVAPTAGAQVLGADAAACNGGQGPAIRATVTGLKDTRGSLKLELYPANEQDFLAGDDELAARGRPFRRISVGVPAGGTATVCIRVPQPGRWALFAGHDRDGKAKFNFWSDGAGFPSARKIGRSRPKLADALIDVGPGITPATIRMQYLRGLGGFSPQS
ncbi:DUF2141 domain-containing protein [Sphingomonas adhaesiva]|uniref:DUF2141 domain-containing protein n=1 Tax=Sphingomonas adhaesiva TaxID=28212 RepID=UPI002FF95528